MKSNFPPPSVAAAALPQREVGVQRSAGAPGETTLLPLLEERLQIDRRVVDRGGWRITKRVESHSEHVDELLREQQVLIERRPVGRTLEGAEVPVQRYEGDVLVLPVVREVLVTEKRLVLVEEIRITRVTGSRHETQQVTLRSEEISIERLAPETTSEPALAPTPDL